MTDSDEIDELREQTRGTDRISADADEKEDDKEETEDTDVSEDGPTDAVEKPPEPSAGFVRAFEERAGRTESGIDPRTVSATDPALSALLLALQDTGELEEVGCSIAEELGAPEPPVYDRDAVVRLAVAYALSETAPDYFGVLSEHV